jgi:hypothetical protein
MAQMIHCLYPSNEEKSERICTATSFHFNVQGNKSIKEDASLPQILRSAIKDSMLSYCGVNQTLQTAVMLLLIEGHSVVCVLSDFQ